MPATKPLGEFEVLGFRRRGFSSTKTPTIGSVSLNGRSVIVTDGSGGGGGGSYPTPTHYASASAPGGGNGSSGSPWTINEAFANAVAGNVVQFAPGTYTGTSPNDPAYDDNFTCVWTPANAGTLGNPIVFIAENPGANGVGTRSKLAHTAATDDVGSGLLHDRDYVEFIGFYINGADALLVADSGHVILQNRGSVVRDFYVDGHMHSTFTVPQDNASFVRIEGGRDCLVYGNYVTLHGNGAGHHNGSVVMTYDAIDCRIYENTFIDNDGGIYFKGAASSQHGNWAYRNEIINSATIGIEFGVNNNTGTGNRGRAFQNVIVGCDIGFDHGRNGAIDVDYVNNTLYNNSRGFSIRNWSFVYRNNIMQADDLVALWNRVGTAITNINSNYNLYFDNTRTVATGEYTTTYADAAAYFAAVRTADENNSIGLAPTYTNAAANDFSLQSESNGEDAALDYLNIQGLGTGATVNMGAYIGNATYDTIGSSL